MNQTLPQPSADEIFRPYRAPELDEGLVFDDVDGLDNPLAVPLVASLRKIRDLRQIIEAYRAALKAAIESFHEQQRALQALRRRNRELLAELRATRQETAA
jgi:hypothetical protein